MEICGNCHKEGARIRTIWAEDGQKREECPSCAPESFEKFTAPSDKKIWLGCEAHPNEYEKKYDKDGLIYIRKPEYRAEQEARLKDSTEEEKALQAKAVAEKRATRRTDPMDEIELIAAMKRATEVAEFLMVSAAAGRDVN